MVKCRLITTDIKILRTPNKRAEETEVAEIIKELENSLQYSSGGVGLAAPQISINKRVAIVRTSEANLDLINPVILEKNKPFVNRGERCLSLPGIDVDTNRYAEIVFKDDINPDGVVATDFMAVVISHEIDHIENILIIDRGIGKYKTKPNDPCPCGRVENNKSVKFKRCHGR